jgi:putative ABC transport system ATP-binding protein
MNILGCLDIPTSGSYFLDGAEVSKLSDSQLADVRNKKIGFVFQSFNLIARTTAAANVELPMLYNNSSNRKKRALEALERVGLKERANHRPNELSGGEQQRVAIARALINNPPILMADEPTGNLDSHSSHEIMDILSSLNKEGITIILVTHEHDIAAYTQRTISLKDGQIVDERRAAQAGGGDSVPSQGGRS